MSSPTPFASSVPPEAAERKFILRGLDGLRAVAVVAVIVYHLWPRALPGGLIGVDLFFVISGYLITALLLKEAAFTERMRLPQFWMRRLRRLVPAMVLCVVVCTSLALLIGGDVLVEMPRQVLGAVTYTSNWTNIAAGNDYFAQTSPELYTNFWSLALEEQFYLAWPVILVVSCMFLTTWLRRRLVPALLGVGSVAAMIVWNVIDNDTTRGYYGLDTHAFGLMIGAVLALSIPWSMYPPRPGVRVWKVEEHYSPGRNVLRILIGWASLVLLPVLASVLSEENPKVLAPWGLLAASILGAGAIQCLLPDVRGTGAEGLRALLSWRPLTWIGARSYGIYLWHWPLMALAHYSMPGFPEQLRNGLVLFLTVIIAALSYRWLEQPVRRLGFLGATAALARALARPGRARWVAVGFSTVGILSVAGTVVACVHAPQMTQAESVVAEGKAALSSGPSPTPSPSASPSETAPEPYHPKPGGQDVTMIGDSVTLAAATSLQDQMPGIDIDAAVSRNVGAGIDLARERLDRGTLGRIVVISLSTNAEMTQGDIDQLSHIAESGQVREVVLVTGQAPANLGWVDQSNRAIREAAAKNDKLVVADWAKASDGRPELLVSDGVHPEPAGQDLYASTVADAVQRAKDTLARLTPDAPAVQASPTPSPGAPAQG
ncbi:acyltransferase family protein [Curtobacterium sp. S6]|uniref:acyltransferase family protein n=1 Tax=Curtobacterium sp. S6 TaxID=1479623 RepID=UPI0006896FDF|nr:acyltransferase family protein [Curtobacterium sp. S6]